MSFSYSIKKQRNYRQVNLEGTLLSAEDGRKLLEELAITDAASARIILDLGKLNFMNSEGFNTLLKILTACRNAGGDVAILHLSGPLKELFLITKLLSVFTVVNNQKEAAALFGR